MAVVIPRYGLLGGAESFVFELTERLAEDPGLQVHVLANRWRAGRSAVRFRKVPVWPFPRWMRPLSFAAYAARALRAGGFDLVHSHERVFGCQLFTFHGIPHRSWVRKVRGKAMSLFDLATDRVERRCLRYGGLRSVMPVSRLARQELLDVYPHLGPRVQVQHPGICTERFDPPDRGERRGRLRRRLGLGSDDVLVLFVGMNFEVKRLDAVLRGLGRLTAEGRREFHLAVVGKGAVERYRRAAAEMGLAERAHFAGAVADATDYFLAADVFAMPSAYDTFGIAVLEAMAAGLPVVISDRVGARDLVEGEDCGFVLPGASGADAVAGALAVLSEAAVRRRMGDCARRRAARQSWDRVADRTLRRYRSLRAG